MAILSKTSARASPAAPGRPPGPDGAAGGSGPLDAGDGAAAVSLRAVRKSYGGGEEAVRGIDLDVAAGEFFALLGPSGCGKTTTLKLIGGFEQPTAGELLIQGRPVAGVPAFQRDVNTVFQNYALFPHLDVRDNVAFGLRMKGVGRAQRRAQAEEALARVHLPDVARRRIDELSGGQQQRVALARALVNRPAVLLLDEPLGALDLKLRRAMQQELKEIQRSVGICFVYVTHDQHEALTMADRIAVMHDGRVEQVGTPAEIYERPASRFVAQFIGDSGFLSGTVRAVAGGVATVALGGGDGAGAVGGEPGVPAAAGAGAEIRVPAVAGRDVAPGVGATVAVRPERVRLAAPGEAPAAAARDNVVAGTVVESEYVGSDHLYRVEVGGAGLLAAREPAAGRAPRAPGTAVAAVFAVGSGVLLEEAAP